MFGGSDLVSWTLTDFSKTSNYGAIQIRFDWLIDWSNNYDGLIYEYCVGDCFVNLTEITMTLYLCGMQCKCISQDTLYLDETYLFNRLDDFYAPSNITRYQHFKLIGPAIRGFQYIRELYHGPSGPGMWSEWLIPCPALLRLNGLPLVTLFRPHQ